MALSYEMRGKTTLLFVIRTDRCLFVFLVDGIRSDINILLLTN